MILYKSYPRIRHHGGQPVSKATFGTAPLTMFGDDVVLWGGNEVEVMDVDGQLLWSVEFSKSITGVPAHGDTLVCAAGVLTAFRRRTDE